MCLNAVKPRRYFTMLTTRAAGPAVVDEGAAQCLCVCVARVSLRSHKKLAARWTGAFVGFAAGAQHGRILLMALTVTVGGSSGMLKLPGLLTMPPGPDPLVLWPSLEILKSSSQEIINCGVSPVHKTQSASFSGRRRGFQTLPMTRDRAPVGTHLLIVPLKDLLNYALPYSQG